MHVDETGQHCFLLADTKILYYYFKTEAPTELDFELLLQQIRPTSTRRNTQCRIVISSLALLPLKFDEILLFQILVGTNDGSIICGDFLSGKDAYLVKAEHGIRVPCRRSNGILDMSIFTRDDKHFCILVATNDTLFQFVGGRSTEDESYDLQGTLTRY